MKGDGCKSDWCVEGNIGGLDGTDAMDGTDESESGMGRQANGTTPWDGFADGILCGGEPGALVGPLINKWNDSESQHACRHVSGC